jgi:hypothetical protein
MSTKGKASGSITASQALEGGGAILEGIGGLLSAKAVNKAARESFRNIHKADAFQRVGLNRRFVEEAEAVQETGYDAALVEAAAVAAARNRGANRGVQGISLNALVSEQRRIGSTNQSRIQDQRDNNLAGFMTTSRGIRQNTINKLDAVPTANFGAAEWLMTAAKSAIAVAKAGTTGGG